MTAEGAGILSIFEGMKLALENKDPSECSKNIQSDFARNETETTARSADLFTVNTQSHKSVGIVAVATGKGIIE